METIKCWKYLKNPTCWCCRLFKCELKCFWLDKSILQTAHEKCRIDFVAVWLLLLLSLIEVRITFDRSGNEINELAGVEDDTSTESDGIEFVFYHEKIILYIYI